jgi:hypothetical protein
VALSGTPASSTTKIGRYDIAKILLKVALKHNKSPQKSLCQSSLSLSLSLSQNITKKSINVTWRCDFVAIIKVLISWLICA